MIEQQRSSFLMGVAGGLGFTSTSTGEHAGQVSNDMESETIPMFPDEGGPEFDPKRSANEWMLIFNHDARNGTALRYLEDYVESLKRSYVLVANKVGIEDFVRKVGVGVDKGVDLLLEMNAPRFRAAENNKAYRAVLRRAVEAYAFMGLHDMVFGSLKNYYAERERDLRKRAASHNNRTSSAALGRAKPKQSTLISAGVAARNSMLFFEDLNKERCPLAKLEYLREYLGTTIGLNSNSCTVLDADGVLTTLIDRIVNISNDNETACVLANLQYIRNFAFCPVPDELECISTQLHGAVCYVLGTSFNDIASISTAEENVLGTASATTPKWRRFSLSQAERIISHPLPPTPRRNSIGFSPRQVIQIGSGSTSRNSSRPSSANSFKHAGEDIRGNESSDSESSSGSDSDSDSERNNISGFSLASSSSMPQPGLANTTQKLGSFLSALRDSSADVVSSGRNPT